MAQPASFDEHAFLADLRRRRAELRESMSALELAMAGPAPRGRTDHWVGRVQAALLELSGDFRAHVAITEGPDGLYRDLLRSAPRLSGPVAALTEEHAVIHERLDGMLSVMDGPEGSAEVDRIRELGTALLGAIVRHRQRGADLVYEAYDVDIGGDS